MSFVFNVIAPIGRQNDVYRLIKIQKFYRPTVFLNVISALYATMIMYLCIILLCCIFNQSVIKVRLCYVMLCYVMLCNITKFQRWVTIKCGFDSPYKAEHGHEMLKKKSFFFRT